MQQIACLKKQCFLSSISIKHKYLTRESYMFIFYFIGSVVKIICFYFPYIKDDRLQKNKKKETWMMKLLFFWCLYLSSFLFKKRLWHRFSCEFCEFSKNTFLTEFLKRCQLAVTFVFQMLSSCSYLSISNATNLQLPLYFKCYTLSLTFVFQTLPTCSIF